MTLQEHLDKLAPMDRARLIGWLEGMTMARRIVRNQSEDLKQTGRLAEAEGAILAREAIRFVQVMIGNGSMRFGMLSPDEQDEIDRIF